MKVRRKDSKRKVRLLRTRALWICMLAGLIAFVVAARPGVRTIFAQSTESQAVTPQAAVNAEGGENTQTALPDQRPKRAVAEVPADPRAKRIAEETADLLKLANSLKAEVDKTTVDTVSVPVIRNAEEIEKLAHKMRSK